MLLKTFDNRKSRGIKIIDTEAKQNVATHSALSVEFKVKLSDGNS